jgi:uncharacterized membrane protein YtjA (UPF0391 family)
VVAARSALDFSGAIGFNRSQARNRAGGKAVEGGAASLGEPPMLKWALIFLIIAIIAGIFGFSGVAQASATIAKVLFGIFLVLFVGAVIIGLALGSKLMS